MKIILASKSPRRRELLKRIVPEFTVADANIVETLEDSLSPEEKIMQLSQRKAEAIKEKDALIIAADTAVFSQGKILGKPKDKEDAYNMLKMLSGKTHFVITAYTVKNSEKKVTKAVKTFVTFRELSEEEISEYIKSEEPFDKAGAYGIQGAAAKFISGIEGDYFSVVGLPVCSLCQTLKEFNIG